MYLLVKTYNVDSIKYKNLNLETSGRNLSTWQVWNQYSLFDQKRKN